MHLLKSKICTFEINNEVFRQTDVMLQPNPATNKVRLSIPYNFGKVKAEFYNIHGVLLLNKTQYESDMFDISKLAPGIYIVKAQLVDTKESRTMRLIVK